MLLAGMSAHADDPAWWTQVGADGLTVINPTGTDADPKSVANIGQAKYMAKRALEAMRGVIPDTADTIEAQLVGPGKIIPTWDPPAAGSPLAKAQFAPLLIGQLKAIADPFYTALRDTDSEWVLAQLAENGTLDTESSDNYFPWTSDVEDNADKAIATIGQLKAVFSLRFESIPLTLDAEDAGVSDQDVITGVVEGAPQASPLDYEIQFKKAKLSLKKQGFSPWLKTSTNKSKRYLTKKQAVGITNINNVNISTPGWVAGYVYRTSPHQNVIIYSDWDKMTSMKNPLNGVVTISGQYPASAAAEQSWDTTTETYRWKLEDNQYQSYTIDPWKYSYDIPPYNFNLNPPYDNYFDAPAKVYYEEKLETENTIGMVKQAALDNPPSYPSIWTGGKPWATFDISNNNLTVTYSRFIFRFKKRDGVSQSQPASAGVYFTPKGSSVRQLLKTVSWNGKTAKSADCIVDPKALRRGLEGDFHIGFSSIYFELDVAKQSQREAGETVVIPANDTDSGGGDAPDIADPIARFPGMDDSWYAGANITLTKVSGAGEVRFKVGTTEVPLNTNLAPNFFKSGGSHTGGNWTIEGVSAGPVKMTLTYTKGSTTMSATRTATVIRGDLDMDSDNSGTIASTQTEKIAEENIENDPTKSGKIVIVRPDFLNDADGVPNSVDGLAELRISASGFQPSDLIKISYDGCNPAGTQSSTTGGVVTYQNAPGALRIWKKPSGGGPPILSGYVAPGTNYSMADLGLIPNTEQWLYVQGVSPTITKSFIKVEMSSDGVVVEDSLVTTIFPIDILEVYSDQIAGNEANKLPTSFYGGQPNNPMLMATRSGANARLAIKMNVPAAHASSIRVGARVSGTTAILGSATAVAPPGSTILDFTALAGSKTKTYEIVAGHDDDGDGVLDDAEATLVFQKTPKTNNPATGGGPYTGSLWNLADKIKIVTYDDFVSARQETENYGSGTVVSNTYDTAAALISAFARGATTISGSSPPEFGALLDASTIPSSEGLSHPLGGKWNAAKQTTTHRLVLPNGSDLSEDVVDSQGLRDMYARVLNKYRATIVAGATSSWGMVTISFADDDIDFGGSDHNDQVHVALGKCRFIGSLEVSVRAKAGGGFDVGALNCYGAMVDLYDFAYGAERVTILGMTLADPKEAARTQAGYATWRLLHGRMRAVSFIPKLNSELAGSTIPVPILLDDEILPHPSALFPRGGGSLCSSACGGACRNLGIPIVRNSGC